jgi:hypothetical protein
MMNRVTEKIIFRSANVSWLAVHFAANAAPMLHVAIDLQLVMNDKH